MQNNYVLLGNIQALMWVALTLTIGGIVAAIVLGAKCKPRAVKIIIVIVIVSLVGSYLLYQAKEKVERQIAIDATFFDGHGKSIDEFLEEFKNFTGQD